jgi:hypothetical protein
MPIINTTTRITITKMERINPSIDANTNLKNSFISGAIFISMYDYLKDDK